MMTRQQLADPDFCERMKAIGIDPERLPGVRYDRVEHALTQRQHYDEAPYIGTRAGAWIDAENALSEQEFEVYQAAHARRVSIHKQEET